MESVVAQSASNAVFHGIFVALNGILSNWRLWSRPIILLLVLLFIENWLSNYLKKKQIEKKFNDSKQWCSDKDILYWLRGMKPNEFEDYISQLYSALGYHTERVGGAYDGGVDVIASKDGINHYIQCKKYISSQVSVGDVRNFAGALIDKMAQGKGIFITTNIFTTEAEKYAEGKPIELIDGDGLIRLIKLTGKEINPEKQKNLGKCPKCGSNLVEKRGRFGKFYGCENFPNCHFTRKC